jgi:hypothetical protein
MSLIDRYVADLLAYAEENDHLESFYTYAAVIIHSGIDEETSIPDEFYDFLKILSPQEARNANRVEITADTEAVLVKFIEIAREHLGLLDVKVFSAVQLTVAQRVKIEQKLVSIFGKEISMILKVDPLLIGGLRVIVGNIVFDNTIKTRLTEMKKNVYKEVYLKQ